MATTQHSSTWPLVLLATCLLSLWRDGSVQAYPMTQPVIIATIHSDSDNGGYDARTQLIQHARRFPSFFEPSDEFNKAFEHMAAMANEMFRQSMEIEKAFWGRAAGSPLFGPLGARWIHSGVPGTSDSGSDSDDDVEGSSKSLLAMDSSSGMVIRRNENMVEATVPLPDSIPESEVSNRQVLAHMTPDNQLQIDIELTSTKGDYIKVSNSQPLQVAVDTTRMDSELDTQNKKVIVKMPILGAPSSQHDVSLGTGSDHHVKRKARKHKKAHAEGRAMHSVLFIILGGLLVIASLVAFKQYHSLLPFSFVHGSSVMGTASTVGLHSRASPPTSRQKLSANKEM